MMERNKTFATKEELFQHLKENKEVLIAEKMYEVKKADAIGFVLPVIEKSEADKAEGATAPIDADKIKLKVVINTTNLLDSHSDVHIPGLWNKTLKENKTLYLLQEHKMSFESIISDEVKATSQEFTWKELGFKMEGTTQALVFDVVVDKSRNQKMFEYYAKGYVKNHSVGMRYVKIALAINSDNKGYEEEKKVWDKYIDQVANRKEVDELGYFYAVTEAKVIEGSAVPIGSNWATPTLSVESKNEPSDDTQNTDKSIIEPSTDTHFDWSKVVSNFN